MSHVLSILLTLALIGIIIYIIAENDHPVQTLAWVIAIIFLPVVGLVLYFLVGHRPRRKRLVEPGELSRLKELTRQTHSAFIVPAPDNYNRLASLLLNTNQAFPMTGNAVRPYVEFYPMLDDLVADLESARDHIHFEFFKFEDDPSGRRVAEVLMRKARSGVAVRVQYDDLGNLGRKKFYKELKAAGIQVKPFLALTLPFISENINFRNHRKIVVIDGRIGYLGGMNIAERYGAGLPWGPWRDTHLRIEGPAVAELQTSFLCDWRFSKGELLAEPRYYPPIEKVGDTLMQVISSGPMDEWRVAMQGLVRLLSNAQHYVYMTWTALPSCRPRSAGSCRMTRSSGRCRPKPVPAPTIAAASRCRFLIPSTKGATGTATTVSSATFTKTRAPTIPATPSATKWSSIRGTWWTRPPSWPASR